MKAEEILARGQTGTGLPDGWVVFPLLRGKVIAGIVGWLSGIIAGPGLFALVAPIVIPFNYEQGFFSAIFTTLLLGVLLFVGLGSAWMMIGDIRRLNRASQYRIIITPEDFVKQEGNKIIHVPLVNIRHITPRGLPPPEQDLTNNRHERLSARPSANLFALKQGRGFVSPGMPLGRKRMRTPPSLAFLDTRDDREILVVNDTSYGDPFTIGALLKQYAS